MKRNKHLLLRWGLLIAVLGGIAPVIHAATVTTTLPVTATVGAVCSVSASGVNFGAVEGFTAVNANGSVTVTCSSGTAYAVALGAGNFFGGPEATRNIVSSDPNLGLAYRLFLDSGLTQEWGDACPGSGGTLPMSCLEGVSGSGSADVWPVYGRLEASPVDPEPGIYSDTVLVTVIF